MNEEQSFDIDTARRPAPAAVEPLDAVALLRTIAWRRARDNYLLIAAALGFLLAMVLRRGTQR